VIVFETLEANPRELAPFLAAVASCEAQNSGRNVIKPRDSVLLAIGFFSAGQVSQRACFGKVRTDFVHQATK
jgi:hypothetical protein